MFGHSIQDDKYTEARDRGDGKLKDACGPHIRCRHGFAMAH